MVGGPFFGVAFGMVRRFARMDTMDTKTGTTAPGPHTEVPEADAPAASSATGQVAFGGQQA
jgi:hypothetical protein